MLNNFIDHYPYLLPVMIFFGRILDVTCGTMRIIFVSKGERMKAPIIGFIEVFIWIVVISQIFSRANDMISYISYASGYAAGNYVGIFIEQRIAYGVILCRIYTKENTQRLVQILRDLGHGSTILHGEGSVNKIDIIETVINRQSMRELENKIIAFDPNIFYVIEDIRTKQNGVFNRRQAILRRWRPGK